MRPYRLQVQCHGNDKGEAWSVQLFKDDVLIATVGDLSDPGEARQAGEYLLFGALNNWSPKLVTRDDVRAGIEPLNAPPEDIDCAIGDEPDAFCADVSRVDAIVNAVWEACLRRLHAAAQG